MLAVDLTMMMTSLTIDTIMMNLLSCPLHLDTNVTEPILHIPILNLPPLPNRHPPFLNNIHHPQNFPNRKLW